MVKAIPIELNHAQMAVLDIRFLGEEFETDEIEGTWQRYKFIENTLAGGNVIKMRKKPESSRAEAMEGGRGSFRQPSMTTEQFWALDETSTFARRGMKVLPGPRITQKIRSRRISEVRNV